MMRIAILLFCLFSNLAVIAQVRMEIGTGYGYKLGSPYDGWVLKGNLSLESNKRLILSAGFTDFKSETRTYVPHPNGSILVESSFNNPISILLSTTEKSWFDVGLIKRKSKLQHISYKAFHLSLGYKISKTKRQELIFYTGLSFAKYNAIFTPTRADAIIDLGIFGIWDTKLYSTAYITYWDLGTTHTLKYRHFVYKTLYICGEITGSKYYSSKDGFYYGGLSIGLAMSGNN